MSDIEQKIQEKGLTAPRITPARIQEVITEETYMVHKDTCLTICVLTLQNGFTVTGESACASPENFDEEIGREIARKNAAEKIWALEGYLLKEALFAADKASGYLNFGQAIECMRSGAAVQRKGWNGKGIFIALQKPDENSKMTHPYIYIDTTGLDTDNEAAPKDRVPWLASQTDMLSTDWCIVR